MKTVQPKEFYFIRLKMEIAENKALEKGLFEDIGKVFYLDSDNNKNCGIGNEKGRDFLVISNLQTLDDKEECSPVLMRCFVEEQTDFLIDIFKNHVLQLKEDKDEYFFFLRANVEILRKKNNDGNFEEFDNKYFLKFRGGIPVAGNNTENLYLQIAFNPSKKHSDPGENIIVRGLNALRVGLNKEMWALVQHFSKEIGIPE